MLKDFYTYYTPEKCLPPLLTGYDLINEFDLTPSPVFKKILGGVEEARLSKQIQTRQDALKLVENFLHNM